MDPQNSDNFSWAAWVWIAGLVYLSRSVWCQAEICHRRRHDSSYLDLQDLKQRNTQIIQTDRCHGIPFSPVNESSPDVSSFFSWEAASVSPHRWPGPHFSGETFLAGPDTRHIGSVPRLMSHLVTGHTMAPTKCCGHWPKYPGHFVTPGPPCSPGCVTPGPHSPCSHSGLLSMSWLSWPQLVPSLQFSLAPPSCWEDSWGPAVVESGAVINLKSRPINPPG